MGLDHLTKCVSAETQIDPDVVGPIISSILKNIQSITVRNQTDLVLRKFGVFTRKYNKNGDFTMVIKSGKL